jgi:6-phospho-3-hexuloisomerase
MMAKRFFHLGISVYVVGDIFDLIIVGSGSGESIGPVTFSKRLKELGAKVAHVEANPDCALLQFRDIFVRIPAATKIDLP